MISQTFEEDHQGEESKDNQDLSQSFTDQSKNQSLKQQGTKTTILQSKILKVNGDEIVEGELTQILQDEDKMITADLCSLTRNRHKKNEDQNIKDYRRDKIVNNKRFFRVGKQKIRKNNQDSRKV